MNKKLLTTGIALLMLAIVTATATYFFFSYQPDQPIIVDDSGSTQNGILQVVNANNQFAFDLYSEVVKSEQGNIFYSPYSISAALAMTYEGAKGQTADEMKSVFHFPETNILRPNFAAIYNRINRGNKFYEIKTGNALWVQQDYPFLQDYTVRIEQYYGGEATNVDFVKETEKTRQTINSFIEEQTNNKIKNLIPQGVLSSMTRLVLTNAIYFKGIWEWEFDESDTRDQDFKVTPTNIIKTPMMFMEPDETEFNYADLEKLQILELPYKGEKISMLILLPKQGESIVSDYTLEDIELSAEKLSEYKSQMKETQLDSISIPKFEFDTKYFMNDTLSNLGMPKAFSGGADFSGMTGQRDLFLSFVIHQAYVKVDEKGTEAAAATAAGMDLLSISQSNIFRADHPFIFIIQEKETGNILFMGRVTDPNHIQDGDTLLFEKTEGWGPCPPNSTCSQSTKLYYSGRLILEGETELQKQLSQEEIDNLINKIESTKVMDKKCSEEIIVDYSATYKLNVRNKKKTIQFPGCEEELMEIDKLINSKYL